MSKFLKAMSKIGLVELTDQEEQEVAASSKDDSGGELSMADIDAILAAEDQAKDQAKAQAKAPPQQAAPRPAPSAPQPKPSAGRSSGGGELAEGHPFEKIYADAGTPDVAYPAEKLLKVLDGLKAMDPPMRKAAVLAMDAADDAWTVADAVLDAERKVHALKAYKADLSTQVDTLVSEAAAEKQRRDEYLQQATQTIRQKIAELEQTLQDEAATIAAEKASIDGRVEAARGTLARESVRLDSEAQRLHEIPQIFAVARPTE